MQKPLAVSIHCNIWCRTNCGLNVLMLTLLISPTTANGHFTVPWRPQLMCGQTVVFLARSMVKASVSHLIYGLDLHLIRGVARKSSGWGLKFGHDKPVKANQNSQLPYVAGPA